MIRKVIFPKAYLQGDGILKNFGCIENLNNRKIFILANRTSIKEIIPKFISGWQEICKVEYEQFNGKCTWTEIDRVFEIIKDKGIDFIVGMGGGSAIDTARVVAKKLSVKFIAVPTVAATDAPTASACVVYNNEGVIVDYFTTSNPDFVLVDSRIIAEAPVRFLVSGMGDALATWFEAETCEKHGFKNIAGGYNSQAAMAIARLCYETLLKYGRAAKIACENNIVDNALEHIIEANILLSGLGFESGGLSTAHGIHDCLCHMEETHNYYHGEKVAFGTLAGLFLEGKDLGLIEEVFSFCESIGLPTTLPELGISRVSKNRFIKAVESVLNNKDSYIHNVSFKLTANIVFESIIMADAFGRSRK